MTSTLLLLLFLSFSSTLTMVVADDVPNTQQNECDANAGENMLPSSSGWAPKSKAKLKVAIAACLKGGDFHCSKGPHGPIGSWDVSGETDISYLLINAKWAAVPGADKFDADLSKWDVSKVTNMKGTFTGANSFNGDISNWDVSSVTSMDGMFSGSSFNGDISKWDVSRVTEMRGMLSAPSFNGDLSKWDVSRVTEMNGMFYQASSFNGDLSKWDVSRVINMPGMFRSASSFNGDLSKWDVSKVTDMEGMFNGAKSFAQTLCGVWKTNSKAKKKEMFDGSSGKLC